MQQNAATGVPPANPVQSPPLHASQLVHGVVHFVTHYRPRFTDMDQENQALLAAILDTAVDSIIVIDDRGIVQSVNPATEKLFGYSSDEVIGSNVKMLMSSPNRDQHDQYLANYRRTGQKNIIGKGREVVARRKDGSTFPVHLAVSEIFVSDRRLFAGIVRDTSDLKEAQQSLTELNEQLEQRVRDRTQELRDTQADLVRAEKLATLGQVSGGIAHEIRNPLNAVKTSAYYLRHAKNPSAEKVREHLERIDRQVAQIDNVITALSDVARMPEPHFEICDICAIVADVARTVSVGDNVTVRNQLPQNLPSALVDPNQIPIVFRNLIRNARDAMPSGGTITLSASTSDGQVLVNVVDTGVGIPRDRLARITEPLYSTKARGMGLGLAISAAILEKNGGMLDVESEENIGTRFTVILRSSDAEVDTAAKD